MSAVTTSVPVTMTTRYAPTTDIVSVGNVTVIKPLTAHLSSPLIPSLPARIVGVLSPRRGELVSVVT